MSSKRRKYTPEFKADAVQLVVVAQRPIAQVAREWMGAFSVVPSTTQT